MKVLITGFDPFGGEPINPAYESVKLLPDKIADAEVIKLEIPTVFSKSAQIVEEKIIEHKPNLVISVGQAGGRVGITVERVAINLAEARIPDNEGVQLIDQRIAEQGPAAYFATIPVREVVENVRERGIPCDISYSAGAYLCNWIMYSVLHMAATKYPGLIAGFIHVPYADEQVLDKPEGTASMSLQNIAKALEAVIETSLKNMQ